MKYNLKNKFKDAHKFSTLSFRSILLDHKHHHQRLFSFLHYRHHIVVDKCLWYRFEGHIESRRRWIERIWKLELGNDRMSGHRWQKWINLNSWLKMGVFFLFFTAVKFTIEALETIMKHLYDLIRYITWCHRVENMLPCESACSVPHPSEINSKLVS